MAHLFYQTATRRPVLDRAEGIHMWAADGRRYVDASSGAMVCNIGHSNSAVLAAMRAQMDRSTFGYRLHFETEAAERLASLTAAKCPEGLDRVFFVSGGSEAVETAVKLARQYALARGEGSRWKVIARYPSYHGCTLGALALTGYDPLTEPFAPMMRAMPKVPAPTAWADGRDPDDPATGRHYADQLRAAIEAEGPETVLGFIVEPIGGASTGALVPPPGYMEAVREICDAYGLMLIHDEVMTGGGRTGAFLGGDHWAAPPDILALSKGFGAGYAPLGAVVAHRRIVEAVLGSGGFQHGFTYAGNPLACAAGAAILEEIDRQGMIANAAAVGAALKARLAALMPRYPFIGDVRGQGLLLAFEIVADRAARAPLAPGLQAHARLVEHAYARGLILYSRRTRGGHVGDHVLVCPPMITTMAQIDEIMEPLRDALDALATELDLPVERAA
jgi:adenosylmethionine-8-amino-7-oxononanoate aminotransferase